MRRVTLILLALMLSLGAFAQAKYQSKVVVLFMGEKNPTFDESKFPNCKFYYTPGIKAQVKELETVSNKMMANAGIKKEGMAYDIDYRGTPKEAYIMPFNGGLFFDQEGIISGRYKTFDNILISPKKNLQGSYDFVTYNSFSKDFVKKGKTTKKAKKAPKKPKQIFDYYGMELPNDFEVEDAEGNKVSIKSLVKGEPLTLLYVLHLKTDYDFNAGQESGADKSGKEFINDALNTNAGIKKLKTLIDIESAIFGHKVVW